MRIIKVVKKIISRAFVTKSEDILKKISKTKVVSFDVFDTLIKRNVAAPQDIFMLVEREYNKLYKKNDNTFVQRRIEAEREARNRSDSKEVCLFDVYQVMEGYSEEEKKSLEQLEIQIEKELSCRNEEMS